MSLPREEDEAGPLHVVDGSRRQVSLVPPTGAPDGTIPLRSPEGAALVHPLCLSSFVGRDTEVIELSRRLRTSRLVTLTGPAGIGKTRLALQVAGEVGKSDPVDVRVVELASVGDSALVGQAVASAVGLRPEKARDLVNALVAHLSTRRLLLVLDNCEHLIDACAILAERLLSACPELSLLATSQEPLGVAGEQVCQVPPLSLPTGKDPQLDPMVSEAVTLFCDRAAAINARFTLGAADLPAVNEICLRLDGIPLAIELAAARTATLSVTEIAERLSDRFSLLTGGRRTAAARHHTLGGALDWSYELLSESEQAMLTRVSVFARGFSLRAAEYVCTGEHVSRRDAVDLLAALVAKSLVMADTGGRRTRYRLLETVHAYGRARLGERGDAHECHRLHAAWFTQLAERAWQPLTVGDEHPWLETLEAEYDNLVSAFQWSLANGQDELALRLAGALVPFWHRKGYFNEGRTRLQRVLQVADDDCLALRARLLGGLGLLATMQGDLSTATTALEESLALSRAGGYERAIASALRLLGFVAVFAQDARAAMPLLEESVAMARAEGDVHSLADALALYGKAQLFLGEVAGARRVFEERRRLEAHHGDDRGDALIGLGWTALAEGDHRGATVAFEEALDVLSRSGEQFPTALTLSFLGELAWARGDLRPARARLEEGLMLAKAIDAPFPHSRCLLGLGRVLLAEGDTSAAERYLDDAVDVAREAQLPWALARCLQARAEAATAGGDLFGARALLDESLALARSKADKAAIAGCLHQLGSLARLEGDDRGAGSRQQEALALFAMVGDSAGIADVLEALAGLAAGDGRYVQAAGLFGAAESLRQAFGASRSPQADPGYEADCRLVRSTLDTRELEDAWAQGAALTRDEALALATRGRGARSRPASGWASLTPMECKVVELAASGLTNREIGERLFDSPRTAQAHQHRVCPKLGISSRRQLRDVRDAHAGGPGNTVVSGRITEN